MQFVAYQKLRDAVIEHKANAGSVVVLDTVTGEAMPVEKREDIVADTTSKSPLELENICFMGTNIISGTASAIVITTGNETYFGSISKSLAGKQPQTSFDKGVSSVSWLLIRFMMVMVPLVFLINGFTKTQSYRGSESKI